MIPTKRGENSCVCVSDGDRNERQAVDESARNECNLAPNSSPLKAENKLSSGRKVGSVIRGRGGSRLLARRQVAFILSHNWGKGFMKLGAA